MLSPKMFIGFVTNEEFEKELRKANSYLVGMLTKDESYLQSRHLDQTHYLGKQLDQRATIEEIENTETHILSLLRRLTPNYPFEKNPPVVIAI